MPGVRFLTPAYPDWYRNWYRGIWYRKKAGGSREERDITPGF